ncbi:MAG: hypothetical protein IIY49_00375 [Eubacterium sp.]|nr:hypothetical protein [Eubacterium sp.]
MDNATLEQCNNMISNVSGLIDKEISQADIDYILQYIKEHGEANWEIYGKLQLLLLKGDDYYELMID